MGFYSTSLDGPALADYIESNFEEIVSDSLDTVVYALEEFVAENRNGTNPWSVAFSLKWGKDFGCVTADGPERMSRHGWTAKELEVLVDRDGVLDSDNRARVTRDIEEFLMNKILDLRADGG